MKRELNLTNWCELPLAAAPLCYPPVLFWPRPGLEKCLIFSAFSWSNPTYFQEIWLFFVLVHELGNFSCVANFQFSAVGHQAGNLCYRTSWGHRSVLTPRERPPPPPLWGLISFPHISNLLQVNYPLPPNSRPHSYCVPRRHCPCSSQSGAWVTS